MEDALSPFFLIGVEFGTFSVECGLVAIGAGAVGILVLVLGFVGTGW